MGWVVFGHTYMHYITSVPFMANFSQFYTDILDNFGIRTLYNASPSTDSFFLIGSTLLSYLTLKHLEKNGSSINFWIMYFVHRYLRLTGVYAMVIAIAATLVKFFAVGPHHFLEPEIEACQESWWSNLLYINNFDPEAGRLRCIGPTWYMAVDMQFYLVSPVFIVPLFYTPVLGVCLNVASIVGSVGYRMYKAFYEREDFTFETVYIKPWTRISVYTTGLLLGFLLFKTRHSKLNLNIYLVLFGWMVTLATFAAVVFGVDSQQNKLSDLDFMFYQGLFRTAWGFALAYLIFMCVKGYGGPINTFLSWGFWAPLAKISYSCYLVHILVVIWQVSMPQYSLYASHPLMVYTCLSNVCISMGIGLLMMIMFEAPFMHIEKIVFGLLGLGKLPQIVKYKTI